MDPLHGVPPRCWPNETGLLEFHSLHGCRYVTCPKSLCHEFDATSKPLNLPAFIHHVPDYMSPRISFFETVFLCNIPPFILPPPLHNTYVTHLPKLAVSKFVSCFTLTGSWFETVIVPIPHKAFVNCCLQHSPPVRLSCCSLLSTLHHIGRGPFKFSSDAVTKSLNTTLQD
ncbi:LAFA_0C03290g1_1 [Lachancea sp. 'fantastica']|nr:LAFA_0C03290g1_1 [Lachancea sp. 'fantastica']